MDHRHFDDLTRAWSRAGSRRRLLGAAVVAAPLLALGTAEPALAKCGKKKPCPTCKRCQKGKCKADPTQDGAPCGSGEVCKQGACVASGGCGAHEQACNGGCISSEGAPCCTNVDCGATASGGTDISCDLDTHQCVCTHSGWGICQRHANGAGTCGACCPGATAQCPGNLVCGTNGNDCGCASGLTLCPYQNRWYCTNLDTDPTCCGSLGGVCEANEACCGGRCVGACGKGTQCSTSGTVPCPTSGCTPCGLDGGGSPILCCYNGCQPGVAYCA